MKTDVESTELENILHHLNYRWNIEALSLWKGDKAPFESYRIYAGFEASSGGHAGLAALAFMVFVLIYTPCMVAVAAEKQELGTKWMWVSIVGQLVLAWFMALVVFQGGLFLGIG